MRIHWFSPLPPQHTDVAHFTMRLSSALMSRFDVTFWTEHEYDQALMPPGADIRRFGAEGLSSRALRIATADGVNLYNLGNNADFHAGIAELAACDAGLPIFHDLRLHHLVFERSRHDARPFARYVRDARELYGTIAEIRAQEIVDLDGAIINQYVERLPFTGLFARNAFAAVCHSVQAQAQLKSSGVAAIRLELPFDVPRMTNVPRVWRLPLRLVAFGYMGSNRRLESILTALSELGSGSPFRLDIYGSLWDETLVKKMIGELKLGSSVKLHGFVSEDVLNAAISDAHLAFHLRHPTMGETSGGILRSWAFATPTLVSAEGWFADLPDSVVSKISVEGEVEHIRRTLHDLAENFETYRLRGEAGLKFLRERHSTKLYADSLHSSLNGLPEWRADLTRTIAMERHEVSINGAARSVSLELQRRAMYHIENLWPTYLKGEDYRCGS